MNLVTNAAREAEVSTPASPHSRELVTISKEELESIRRLMAQLEGPTTTSTSTFAHSGTSASAYNASLTSFSPSWIIDSGATDHMTESVLHVPNFATNLLSISSITKSMNCSVTFFPTHCVFQDLETRRMIGSGREDGGLYLLDMSAPSVGRKKGSFQDFTRSSSCCWTRSG
ncbi:hypothetical protein SLEP1_g59913 [Rubroshorea leprosula]|uniref:Uncharacterized protein n=1 Tax=Rubroshorea leprosula TaxID=152421 RepID=A0AAV5MXV0_9ROSI|nr:hypothetical protein SLEP1_g59913 [Rubroshorea leprosula]